MTTTYSIINPTTCPYHYIKIGGRFYKRAIDTRKSFEKDGIDIDELHETCHDCGVTWGNIHHIGCDVERCPKCDHQLISCECHMSNGIKFYKRLPKSVTPKCIRKDVLRKFIEK